MVFFSLWIALSPLFITDCYAFRVMYDENAPLVEAAIGGDEHEVRRLVYNGVDVDYTDIYGTTALIMAAYHGHATIVIFLLENDAEVDLKDTTSKHTALVGIAPLSNRIDIARILIAYGADVNAAENSGSTALINATYGNNEEMIKLLLDNGARIDDVNCNRESALMIAVKHEYMPAIKILIARGANIKLKNSSGKTASMLTKNKEIIALLK